LKNLLNKKRTVVGLIFVITAFVAVFGYSIIGSKTTVHAEIMDSKKAVSSEKEWTVNFNVPVNFSTQYAEIRNGKLYFKGETGEEEPYLFDTEKQEDINEQIYRLAQVLIEDNFYTSVRHLEKSEVNPSRAAIRFAQRPMNIVANNTAFDILIFEHQGYNLAEIDRNDKLAKNPDGVIDVNKLWFDLEKASRETFSQKVYTEKLQESLKVMFPEQYQEIYDYMFHYYVDSMKNPENYEEKVEVKTFGNVRIDTFIYNSEPSFYYTYLDK